MPTLQATEPTSAQLLQVATFVLGELILGIDIDKIREITRVGEIAPVADAHPSVRGITSLRGDVVTVLDLRTILGMDDKPLSANSRLVIIEGADENVGLLVDRVNDVITVSSADEEALPPNAEDCDTRYFCSVYKLEHDLLVLLNVSSVIGNTSPGVA